MASIKVSTGLKTYDIEDENGNIRGKISFNPADVNLYPRAKIMVDNIMNMIDSLSEIKEEEDEDTIKEKILDCDSKIKHEINVLFDDDNTSNVVFGNQNCLNVLNGETFVERFIYAFMPIIEKETTKEMKKAEQRINKYTSQVK